MRTPEDIVNRKEANQRYYKLGEKKKKKWGTVRQETEDGKILHEEWAIKNGYRNEDLHAINTKRFTDYER